MTKTLATIAAFWIAALPAAAQIGEIRIGVNGLTCSQCTRSVEVKLRRLPFVTDVSMDLANTSGVVQLAPGRAFRPEAVAKAIRDAGFSVRYVRLVLRHPEQAGLAGNCLSTSGLNLQLNGAIPAATAGSWLLTLQGKAFGSAAKSLPAANSCGAAALQATAAAE